MIRNDRSRQKLGDRLGLRVGDSYVLCRHGRWEPGTIATLKSGFESGKDFALNILRDAVQTRGLDRCNEASLDESEDSTTSVESNVMAERRRTNDGDEALLGPKCIKKSRLRFQGTGYWNITLKTTTRILSVQISYRNLPPSVYECDCSIFWQEPTQPFGTLCQFYRVAENVIPFVDGLRKNDILFHFFNIQWLLGTEGERSSR